MTAVSDFVGRMNTKLDAIEATTASIQSDVQFLVAHQGVGITPEEQAMLDALEARTDTALSNLNAVDALFTP